MLRALRTCGLCKARLWLDALHVLLDPVACEPLLLRLAGTAGAGDAPARGPGVALASRASWRSELDDVSPTRELKTSWAWRRFAWIKSPTCRCCFVLMAKVGRAVVPSSELKTCLVWRRFARIKSPMMCRCGSVLMTGQVSECGWVALPSSAAKAGRKAGVAPSIVAPLAPGCTTRHVAR